MPEYLTPSEFCERYHIAPRTVDRWRGTGPSRTSQRLCDSSSLPPRPFAGAALSAGPQHHRRRGFLRFFR